jgi:hypothetical protein
MGLLAVKLWSCRRSAIQIGNQRFHFGNFQPLRPDDAVSQFFLLSGRRY